jgi:hypothetical protein
VKAELVAGSVWIGGYVTQKIGCDGRVDELRISNTLRLFESVPDRPYVADANTIGLWHLDTLTGRALADDSQTADRSVLELVPVEEDRLRGGIADAERELAALYVPVTYAGVRRQPEPTRMYLRGDIQKPGPVVAPASPSALTVTAGSFRLAEDSPESQRRLQFAEWLTDRHNPLLARVMVNRIWHYHFGRGLVETPSDFGFHGGQPSHPELLDWLAAEFIASNFSIKHMHRLIMLSATYQQSSEWNSSAGEVDSMNRWLWRFEPRRLEAEAVRDAMLAVSGQLNWQIGGPSFRPFTTTALLTQFYHRVDDGRADFNRRTIYRINVNTAKDPLLDSLDCPAPSVSAPSRRSTTTALQALALKNDSFVLRQAERLADRLRAIAGPEPGNQVRIAVLAAFGREPSGIELGALERIAAIHGLEHACWVLLNSSEFLYLD